MIVRAILDDEVQLPGSLRSFALTQDQNGRLDVSLGKCYIVYAIRTIEGRKWYFVHTDTRNDWSLWWMPSMVYEIVDNAQPVGWQKFSSSRATLISYPSLSQFEVENGILDAEKGAIATYMKEVRTDSTFPDDQTLSICNQDFNKKQSEKTYAIQMQLARERGYERPTL